MIKAEATGKRTPKSVTFAVDLVVVGGGLAGLCGAITAARAGIKVVLVTDRPVLGGNSSSEVRLWVLGATSHMGNNNRWAREGGVIDELLVENMYRNPDSNPLIFDTILLEKVVSEPNITLFASTHRFFHWTNLRPIPSQKYMLSVPKIQPTTSLLLRFLRCFRRRDFRVFIGCGFSDGRGVEGRIRGEICAFQRIWRIAGA